ncbi:glycosyl hydrolase 115 family protein [Mucilaginibacter mali]|uniref:Glycosyl hydrolase 115 family protein n=1 Tax=Mucilaginibacter mali TaxID=2740462 RepID=A0A7D4Q3I1_9SPHI|nr:glycosyl hydrolase 115 family protein [Mucilaginibacter mali]QKJ32206.1 glycosyl hydrolase 115 family protein [Mucilaginibacter mali]
MGFCQPKPLALKVSYTPTAGYFTLADSKTAVNIVTDTADNKVVQIAAQCFVDDIKNVTGKQAAVIHTISSAKPMLIAGTIGHSALIDELIKNGKLNVTQVKGKWETYSIVLVKAPFKNVPQALVIVGSDQRGTAYGLFELSKTIGIQPFYWWADVTAEHHDALYLSPATYTSEPPSVKFRGIFINDEDWGLQPWAAKTLEPETKDIGPKTYAKVFELLLRLKANLIWPAMHPSTKAFYHYPGNIKVAEDYQIVIGSSHAEPMLRNNVSEWNEKTMGNFNYLTNQQKVDDYWESRVKESSHINGIYTIGMRGVHDSGIEGVKTVKETVPLLERIFVAQRDMLKKYVNPDINKVPQVFTPYKEVLEVYDGGLKVPEDVTLVWPDDNYGYIQRLDNKQESERPGGSGVYYHVSYWGRPHDYIWLCSTSPGLIREEMMKAYDMQARNLWVVNVGDIKPAEYDIQFFLDMAYNIKPFKNSAYTKTHLQNWVSNNLSSKDAGKISDVLWRYYQLAFERKPEFMGWSQTEPTTPTKLSDYNHFYYGDQGQQRIDAYNNLQQQAKTLWQNISPARKDAFYQLVYYPVTGTALMNKKFLYRDKAYRYAQQGRLSTQLYDSLSRASYQSIIEETKYYNTKMAGGKWANIIMAQPRNLPVYAAPDLKYEMTKSTIAWQVQPEGATLNDAKLSLPAFADGDKHFIDLFLCRDTAVNYTVQTSAPWINVSQQSGTLQTKGKTEQRLWISINNAKLPAGTADGAITIKSGSKSYSVAVTTEHAPKGYTGFIEHDGYVSIYAKHFDHNEGKNGNSWMPIMGLGKTDTVLQANPVKVDGGMKKDPADTEIKQQAALSYSFYTTSSSPAEVKLYTLPTLPLNNNFSMRYAVSIDDGPATMLDFKTVGRTEEWKQNVLSNSAVRSVKVPVLSTGKHTIHIYMIDPGVVLDRMVIDLGGLRPGYGVLTETRAR